VNNNIINKKIIASAEAINDSDELTTTMSADQHSFCADEPLDLGGKDLGPSPVDYLCAALASCKVITLRMYAKRKQWPVRDIKIKVELVKGDILPSGNNTFFCELSITGELDDAQLNRLLEISKACPVQRMLAKPMDVETVITTHK
jgi:putative redox protein